MKQIANCAGPGRLINGAIHQPISCKAWAKVAMVRSSGVVSSQFTCVGWFIKRSPILSHERVGVLLRIAATVATHTVSGPDACIRYLMHIDSEGQKEEKPSQASPDLACASNGCECNVTQPTVFGCAQS